MLTERLVFPLVGTLLVLMAVLMVLSMRGDALTFDELAHIPAGYSYLTQQDYRVNPEHPPLAKDIAALPLLFLGLDFPAHSQNWLQDSGAPPWWVQFDLGNEFLYKSGNNPLSIIFWSRLPMILLTLALGAFLFFWTRKLLGNGAALAALLLFAFSPSFLAHGRLVTTDVAAALGILVAAYFWIEFLKQPTKATIAKAGAAFAFAFLLKFGAVLLIPFFALITIVYALLHKESSGHVRTLGKYAGLSVLAGIVALVLIISVYQLHILNYPAERQLRDTIADLQPGGVTAYEQAVIWMADAPAGGLILRPFAQFGRGILMATQRGQFGNTVFFQGEIKAGGWWYYFPLIYLYKAPLAFHVLTLLGILGIVWSFQKQWYRGLKDVLVTWWIKKHFAFFAFAVFTAGYFLVAMLGNLNIGMRHLLPLFPMLYILTIWGLKELLSHIQNNRAKRIAISAIVGLFLWYIGSSLMAFPHYIPYYNALAGGTQNGYQIAVDSNYDWGQDFYKLLAFVEANNIQKLHLDYFGGEDPAYWLREKYVRLDSRKVSEDLSRGLALSEAGGGVEGWVAVSLNQLQGGLGQPIAGFDQPTGYYTWLQEYAPTRLGNSIFIYNIR
ncbi:MAG TPA: glycosyltransferase family 39 protein [Candidatus Paceibacterota bacterium]